MAKRTWSTFVVAGLMVASAVAAPWNDASAAPGDIGFEGPSYSGSAGSHPSQEKPESKLWHHDGFWWGSMWSNPASAFTVHRLDRTADTWVDTGTVLETVGTYRQDALFDGTKVYVASHRYSTSVGTATARLSRLSYNSGAKSWSVDPGFPATINNARSETLTIDKDSTGRLWATWTSGTDVWLNHTNCVPTCNDASWATPFKMNTIAAVGSAANISSDDISAVVAFQGKIGVLWSNQASHAFYFAIHNDGASPTSWSLETALSGTNEADDHINFASDGTTLFVAVKTSHDSSAMPETYILKRTPTGSWSATETTDGADMLTRPIVTYDQVNNRLHWFAADVGGGKIYTKDSSASTPSFVGGKGTAVMFDASANNMNNPTSTKQAVGPSTGLVVLATDQTSDLYWHHDDPLGGVSAVVAGFTATPQSGGAPLDVQFTDTSVGNPTSWSWDFGDGGSSSLQHPLHTYTTPGLYTVTLTATNGSGADVEVKSNYINVVGLEATFTVDPSEGAAPLSVQFTDASTGSPDSWSWNFGDGNTSTARNPVHVYNNVGTYDVTLTITRGTASDSTTVQAAVTVTDTVPTIVVADALVRSDRPNNNYGGLTYLRNRDSSVDYRSLVRFDVQGTSGPPAKATLRMFVTDASPHAGNVYVVDNSWSEFGVTDGNAPVPGSTPDAIGGAAVVGAWHEWDVTNLVTGAGVYSFMLVSNSSNSSQFSSREGANPPQLVIEGASGPPPPPTAAFTGTPLAGSRPLVVQFTDTSAGSPTSWSWDFGDGQSSTQQHPSHTYQNAGSYTVTLTATNATGSDGETKTGYVVVSDPPPPTAPVANFSGAPLAGSRPLVVQFTDTSTGSPTSWSWDFGDGQASTQQHPSHTYQNAGSYTVTLTATNATGSDGETKTGYIVVSDPPAGPVTFTATQDAYVQTDRPDSNYGSATHLRLRLSTTVYESLVRFDVTGLAAPPTRATLRLFVTDDSPSAGTVSTVNPTHWNEMTVTWNTRPALGVAVAADQPSPLPGQWVEWDVTSAVAGNGAVSFSLASTSGNSVYFNSRETGTNPPELVVTP